MLTAQIDVQGDCRRPGSLQRPAMSELIYRIAQSRDAQAFDELFAEFAPRLRSYMLRQGADAATAEELAQETMLTVWRKARLYSGEKGSASTWIYTIARNLRIDRIRRETAWQELPDELEEEASDATLPDEAASQAQRQVRVHEALKTLPEEQYEVIALSYLDGLSHSEIAERLQVPLGTVKSRMRLAYQKLRETVEDLQ